MQPPSRCCWDLRIDSMMRGTIIAICAATVLLSSGCAPRNQGSDIERVTIYQPYQFGLDYSHMGMYARSLTYERSTGKMTVNRLGAIDTFDFPSLEVDSMPLADLRWAQMHGGFDQPIATLLASNVVGITIELNGEPPVAARFASQIDLREPPPLQRLQRWYRDFVERADGLRNKEWAAALGSAWRSGDIREIQFTRRSTCCLCCPRFTFTAKPDGTAHLVFYPRTLKQAVHATGRFNSQGWPGLEARAMSLQPRAPVLQENDSGVTVTIVSSHRTFIATGSDDLRLDMFSSRADQLAHSIDWSPAINWGNF